jgi:hypothetical protein
LKSRRFEKTYPILSDEAKHPASLIETFASPHKTGHFVIPVKTGIQSFQVLS